MEQGGMTLMESHRSKGEGTKARIRPRPFMGPAMEKE